MQELSETTVKECVELIPADWQVDARARAALVELICRRAAFVADTILNPIAQQCWPGKLFDCD